MSLTTQNSTPTLYFAYGSNLCLTQMAHRCPHSTYHSLGVLPSYKWIIGQRGYANIIKTHNTKDSVIGMLYKLTQTDEEALDLAEGVPHAYTKHQLPITILTQPTDQSTLNPEPSIVEALVYIDESRLREGVCREEYIHRMNRGIKDAVAKGMSKVYVETVIRPFVREEDVRKDEDIEDPFFYRNPRV